MTAASNFKWSHALLVSRAGVLGRTLLLVVVTAACGGGDNAAGQAGAPSAAQGSAAQGATPAPGQTGNKVAVSKDNPCSVMLPNEVGDILGVPSKLREIMDEMTCRYHFEPPKSGAAVPTEGETFIEVTVHWTDGRVAAAATRLAGRALGGEASGFEKLSGIGDEAWLAPLASYLSFSKGDVGVEIDMRMMPGERDKAVRLAQLIAGRL